MLRDDIFFKVTGSRWMMSAEDCQSWNYFGEALFIGLLSADDDNDDQW